MPEVNCAHVYRTVHTCEVDLGVLLQWWLEHVSTSPLSLEVTVKVERAVNIVHYHIMYIHVKESVEESCAL